MKMSKKIASFLEASKTKDEYWVEAAKLKFAVCLERQRKAMGLSYTDIAKKLGTSSAYITKVFRGDANLTIETMVKLARANNASLDISFVAEKSDAQSWISSEKVIIGRFVTPPFTPANDQPAQLVHADSKVMVLYA